MSTTAFGLGSKYFALYEVSGVGIQWHTFSQSPVEGDDFNLLLSMMMLIVDAVVYGVLTWYIEAVHPGGFGGGLLAFSAPAGGEGGDSSGRASAVPTGAFPPGMYGLPRPWYFPLQKSYWLGNGRTEAWDWSWPWSKRTHLSITEEDQACAMENRRMGKGLGGSRANAGHGVLCGKRSLSFACLLKTRTGAPGQGGLERLCFFLRRRRGRTPSPSVLCSLLTTAEESRGIEEEPTHLPLVVCVDKLTKIYKTDQKLALNKLSLNLYENQVVSFLGHNGAGKTTTM